MGGNIFDNTKRATKEEYFNIYIPEVSTLLYSVGITDFRIIPAIGEKEDFGDLDIVVDNTPHTLSKIHKITEQFPSVYNSDYVSFRYKDFQVDLIRIPILSLDYSVKYYSYNDLGNLVGRLAKANFGIKHGHLGLYFPQFSKDGMRILNNHLLSLDFNTILEMLQLDVNKYQQGFNTYKEMFDFVISSPFFIPEIFAFENLNNKNRVRDRKRKTYNMFLKYLDTLNLPASNIPKLTDQEKESKILTLFPSLKTQLNKYKILEERSILLKSKINGYIVQDIVKDENLTGLELGQIIKTFKAEKTDEWLEKATTEEIAIEVLKIYKGVISERSNTLPKES